MRPKPRYQPGDRIGGRYQVHQALMGGMGEVYLCLDLEEIYPYALKTFQQRYQTNAQRLRRTFEKEVSTWVALEKHPNIVRCFHMDILDNQPFMFLEWIAGDESRGADLRSWLRRGPLDLRLALDFTIDICRGLIHANQKQPGIIHRDLKPENILVAQGRVAKITDFGLAQIVQEAELEITGAESEADGRQSLLGQGGVVGTPPYMAPEQWRGEVLDVRTDIYAVGCILYELLTGSWPFQATTLDGLRRQHLEANIPKMADGQALPDSLDTLLAGCLAKRRAERFASADDMLQELALIYHEQFAEPPKAIPIRDEFTVIDYGNRGVTYDNLQQYDEALADYSRAIQLDPTLARIYYNRGNTYSHLQRYEKALADYSRAIQLDPTYTTAYYNRGITHHELQRYEEALADYSRAIQLDPTWAKAYYNRGNTYSHLQRYEKALADYSRAIQLDPNYALAYSNRGITYGKLQRHEEALADENRAIELAPTDASAYHDRGITQGKLQRYEEALADFGRAIELAPKDASAYYDRGVTYHYLQRYEEALADFGRASELDPKDAKVYTNIGGVLANRGQWRDALPYFEKAAQLGDPLGAQNAALVRQRLGIGSTPQVNPAKLAFEAFQEASSADAMQRAVAEYPFMTGLDFIAAVEQVIAQQAPPYFKPMLEQRLAWLRQIANEQKREE